MNNVFNKKILYTDLEVKSYPDTPTLPEVASGGVGCTTG